MGKKTIVIFRSVGKIANNELENMLLKKNFKVLTFPILRIAKINSKPIRFENSSGSFDFI